MVSDLQGERSLPLRSTTGQDIAAYAGQKKGKRLTGPRRFLGGWADKDATPQRAVLDRSTHYPDTPLGDARSYVRMVKNAQKSRYVVHTEDVEPNPAMPQDQPRDLDKVMRRLKGENVG